MKLFSDEQIDAACKCCGVADLSCATIGDTVAVSSHLEKTTGIPFVRMDQGDPGLPANSYGIEAEKRALDRGVALYPRSSGIPELKEATSRFVKAFLDIDVSPRSCIPTVGSVEGSFASFATSCRRIPGKEKVLFIDPGFPVQKAQLSILGVPWISVDIYNYRGAEKLRARLLKEFEAGDIAAVIYSNPDNPAWICLAEEELQVIGELATSYDAIVLEDLAYFCMDFRKELGTPWQPPFVPTVARYTDNYVLMLSASKIFSYAGQRIAVACIGDALYDKVYPGLVEHYGGLGGFGYTFVSCIIENVTSGCTTSTQYAYAEMMQLSCDGVIDFVTDTRLYERRAARMKDIFLSGGFHIVYDEDVDDKVGDGFFFTIGYKGMSSGELVSEMMYYGMSSVNLSTTGSCQEGVRICVSRITEDGISLLEERVAAFAQDH